MLKYFFKNNYITAMAIAIIIMGFAIKEGVYPVIALMAATIAATLIGGNIAYRKYKRTEK